MEITAQMVKELRERTGAGMMECKKVLTETKGDAEAAIDLLRTRGQAKAAKSAGRIAAEGIIAEAVSADGRQAVMLEINCETDFVARSDDFIEFAKHAAEAALKGHVTTLEQLANTVLLHDSGKTIEIRRGELVGKLGENIQIRRIEFIQSQGHLGHYIHSQRIGVILSMEGGDTTLAKDIAMHIAAMNPKAIAPENVPADIVAREKEIYITQVMESGKSAELAEKIVGGKVTKFLSDISLTGQPFIKDSDKTVGQLLQHAKAKVVHFTRFEVGEGIEKKVDNFVEEVMAQVNK